MTNKEFLVDVQKTCHIEMPRCLMLMGCLQKMLGNAAVDQVPVVLSGLGVLTSHKHPEYVQEDPQTGAMTLFPPRITYHIQSEQSVMGTPCADLLAEYAHTDLEETYSFVEALVLTINKYLVAGEEIEVPGIGTFKNVLTHQTDLQHVDFLPCDQMKELVNAPFSCFEPFVISSGNVPIIEEDKTEKPVEIEMPVILEEVAPIAEESVAEEIAAEEPVTEDIAAEEPVAEVPTVEEPVIEDVQETPAIKEVATALEPKIMVQKDGHIVIQDADDSADKSDNLILWVSLSLIMVGCGFLVWLMFGDDVRMWDDSPTEAKVVEPVQRKAAPVTVEPDSAIFKETQAPVVENVTAEEEKTVEKIEVEPTKPVNPEPVKPVKTEPSKPIQPDTSKPVAKKEFHRMKDASGKEVTVTLQSGSRLTLIALEHFGDKSFWPYIFDANTDKLKAPNLVQSGMVLYLPDPSFYGIDATDPASVRKAKNRAAQLLK